MTKLEQRRFPRFKVSALSELRCEIPNLNQKLYLISFGQGGCGFYCSRPDERLRLSETAELERKRRFQLKLQFADKWDFDIQANLVYERKVNINGQDVYYYGFEFIEAEIPKIEPVVEKLQTLALTGEIGVC